MDAISYNVIHDDIHVFVFATNEEVAVNAYMRVWHEEMPLFWRHNTCFNQVLRVLMDLRRSGPLPLPLVTKHLINYPQIFPDRPDVFFAYLMFPQPNFIAQVRTMGSMIDRENRLMRRFFNADERDSAIAWLTTCDQQQTTSSTL